MVSIPHGGTWIPGDIERRLNDVGKRIKDTDWFLDRLYDFAELADASLISSTVSRYVVDLNRSKHDTNLYPGQNTTGLCPAANVCRRGHLSSGKFARSKRSRIANCRVLGSLLTRSCRLSLSRSSRGLGSWSCWTPIRSPASCRGYLKVGCRILILELTMATPVVRHSMN